MKNRLRAALDIYKPLFIFAASLLLALSISRALLVAVHLSRVDAVEGLLFVMLQGLRFDFIVVCTLALPPALLAPILCNRTGWLTVMKFYLISAFVIVIFMEAASPAFIDEYDLRPNILFVEYLKYPREVASMLWLAYKADIFIGLFLVFALGLAFSRYLTLNINPQTRMKPTSSLLCSLLVLLVCAVGIRSSFGHRPANPSTVAFSTDLLVNDLSISSLYSVLYAIYNSQRYEGSVEAYGHMTNEIVLQQVRDDMAVRESDFLSVEAPTLHRSEWVQPRDQFLNLVIILQESLGAEFVGALGGVNVTPELDSLSEEGIWFDNLYATGTRSVRGIEAVVTGFTPTPARSVVKLPKSQSGFFTIAELLARRGYDTSFIYGGEAHFDNMRHFFVGNGFARIIEEKDFADPAFRGSWGVSDEDLFQRAHEEFSQISERPFFSLVFTSSNHTPFEFPQDAIALYEKPQATVNNAVKYADHAMGDFFRQAKNSDYWDNTLFLVVADHNSRVRGANLVPIEYFHIPALVLGGPVKPQTYSRLSSQIDLLPTMLGLMGVDEDHPATGHDLFRPDIDEIPGRAIMQYNTTQAYMQGDQVVVMELNKEPALYQKTDAGLVRSTEPGSPLIERALAYSIWSSRAYQERLYSLPETQVQGSSKAIVKAFKPAFTSAATHTVN